MFLEFTLQVKARTPAKCLACGARINAGDPAFIGGALVGYRKLGDLSGFYCSVCDTEKKIEGRLTPEKIDRAQ
jgi:hypothetical protein